MIDYGDEFRGRRVLVTGAAGLIGTWIAEAFHDQGAQLLLTDSREGPLSEVAGRLGAAYAVADLSTGAGVSGLLAELDSRWSTVDVLVNNAGVYPRTPVATTERETVERIFAINVLAPYQLARHVIATMQRTGTRGSIVNLSSGAAKRPTRTGGVYSASKAALDMLTRSLALETGESGIRVNGVGPGFAPGSEVSELPDEHVAKMRRGIPLGRTSGPGDAPSAILWLCSAAASFVTGTVLDVDGGRTAGDFTPSGGA
ncbi:SDR family NAD(P)-dependent oxidoreductase [Amycolatopsis jiangsuensis]|uniref:3-oxoacyl-[acyl-carrier protein] reductase n=1 Tax=Amycolatopsis jiangsuensis TaxID=1181879 RepID=A0A840IRB5_9PSEU|nr:SDR family oxidoreductase [Amycolatopsis jiangsuensis]MBB4683917.1 3-oxoacyl-[acyl-carrier protein] reductase [Amycolatopsis jiangsuensis]